MNERAIDCAYVASRVHALLDGELDEREADLLRHHIDACVSCIDEADLLEALKSLVRRSCGCERAPDTLRVRVLSQITTVTYRRLELGDAPA